MRKIAVFTGTRAEYGLLFWLLSDLKNAADFELQLIVSGTHLSPEFGSTLNFIEADGFEIAEKVEVLLSSNTAVGTAKSLGLAVIGYADALVRLDPDCLIVLGDRFEALAVAQTAMLLRIPIGHIHGGEVTEGAYDDAIRHAITKLSYLHFTSTDGHRKRVIQLGESPDRVFNFGAIGLDHVKRTALLDASELSGSLGFALSRYYFLVTYHPVTLGDEPPAETFSNLLDALDLFPDYQVIITYPNADDGGREIIPLLEHYASLNKNRVFAIPSLGHLRYLSVLRHASAVIGNSSSGIIEAPSFMVPTVNIGMRQYGRTSARSVIHCAGNTLSIQEAINESLRQQLKNCQNPYGQGQASVRILDVLRHVELAVLKEFYDLN